MEKILTLDQIIDDVRSALGFENGRVIDQGGQKLVLRGQISGADAVAKVVSLPSGPGKIVTLKRAEREVELLSAVDCENVVKVLTDAVEIGDPSYAVCWAEEYLDGADLSDCLHDVWDEQEVLKLLVDMSRALKACHELEVVHRDLSPRNVRRTSTGRFILMDPGLARHLTKSVLTGLYQPGTPGWRSPEHVFGGYPIPASDIFALGILAFYALTGEFPIDPNLGDEEHDRALVEEQIPSISEIKPGISKELADLVDNCLKRQVARRYLDGSELEEAIMILEESL